MSEELALARLKFSRVFDYYPQFPPMIDFDQKEYARELEKCIEDNFDYTIEKYGTIPSQKLGLPDVILD